MATKYHNLPIGGHVFPDGSSNNLAPGFERVKSSDTASSTNTPPYFFQYAFDASNDESVMWQFQVPGDYVGSPAIRVKYKMASATSGVVRFEGRIAALTDGDATSMNAKAFATTNSVGDTVPATTAGKVGEFTISLTNNDSLAALDMCVLQLRRDADGTTGTDDAAGDCHVVGVMFEYSDT